MKLRLYLIAMCLTCCTYTSIAKELVNPGFENGWRGWLVIDPKENAVGISEKSLNGVAAAQITSSTGYFAQTIPVRKNTNYSLKAHILGAGILGAKVNSSLFVERTKKSKKWKKVEVKFNTGGDEEITIFAQFNGGKKTLFDDFSFARINGKPLVNSKAISLTKGGLSPDLPPGRNFELIDWYLSVPVDRNRDGWADRVEEVELSKGFTHKNFFYTARDGGLVFRAPVHALRMSKRSKYVRTELREMLRRGNPDIDVRPDRGGGNGLKNNWVLSTAPKFAQKIAGGVDGALIGTLAVNRVTVTGSPSQIGRIIIAQIASKINAPVRLYYRKLPHHKKGSFYIKHEIYDEDEDVYFNIVGSRRNSADEPKNGIALNEKFTFEIIASGHVATVAILKDGKKLGSAKVYLTEAGYDAKDIYLYYQVGVNNQNNTADKGDYAQATYYKLENTHIGYDH